MLSIFDIYIKELQLEEMEAIYMERAQQDFPQEELKPYSMIKDLWQRGNYKGYGFYEIMDEEEEEDEDDFFDEMEDENGDAVTEQEKETEKKDKLYAYAFTMADPSTNILLLDYFAVCKEERGQGYGGIALALLKEHCVGWDGMIIEVEDDSAVEEEAEKEIRRRRISFYERNDVIMTDARSKTFGVDYKLMIMPIDNPKAGNKIGWKLSLLYRKMLPDILYRRSFRLKG